MRDFQQDISRLINWCQRNRLSIDVKKKKFFFYPHTQTVENYIYQEIKILGSPVSYVSSDLYLGVDIDNLLSLNNFILIH